MYTRRVHALASLIPNERGRRRGSQLQINIPGAVGGRVFLIKYWTPDNGHFLRNDVTTRPSTIFFSTDDCSLYIQSALAPECEHTLSPPSPMCAFATPPLSGEIAHMRIRYCFYACLAIRWRIRSPIFEICNLSSAGVTRGTLTHSFDGVKRWSV